MNVSISLLFTFILAFSGFSAKALTQDEIPVIGVDKDGNEINIPIKVPFFKGQLKKAYRIVGQTSIEALNSANDRNPRWSLSGMEIGVGLFASVGIGSAIKASAEPTLLFVFAKTKSLQGGL